MLQLEHAGGEDPEDVDRAGEEAARLVVVGRGAHGRQQLGGGLQDDPAALLVGEGVDAGRGEAAPVAARELAQEGDDARGVLLLHGRDGLRERELPRAPRGAQLGMRRPQGVCDDVETGEAGGVPGSRVVLGQGRHGVAVDLTVRDDDVARVEVEDRQAIVGGQLGRPRRWGCLCERGVEAQLERADRHHEPPGQRHRATGGEQALVDAELVLDVEHT